MKWIVLIIMLILCVGCEDEESQLRKRVMTFQNLIQQQKFQEAYPMVSQSSRNTPQGSLEIFVNTRKQAYSNCKLDSFKIMKVEFHPKNKELAFIDLEYHLIYNDGRDRLATLTQPWEKILGTWYRK